MIRAATLEDVPRLVEMGRRFHEAKQHRYSFNPTDTAGFFVSLIESPAGVVLVADDGFLAGVLASAPSNNAWISAFEVFWWSEGRNGLRLMRAFEEWAASKGANEVKFSHPVNEPVVAKILERAGHTAAETIYEKGL